MSKVDAAITFRTSGDDFKAYGRSEVLRILREINEAVIRGEEEGYIYDGEGEIIGRWNIPIPV